MTEHSQPLQSLTGSLDHPRAAMADLLPDLGPSEPDTHQQVAVTPKIHTAIYWVCEWTRVLITSTVTKTHHNTPQP